MVLNTVKDEAHVKTFLRLSKADIIARHRYDMLRMTLDIVLSKSVLNGSVLMITQSQVPTSIVIIVFSW